jgi:hypothetical protein
VLEAVPEFFQGSQEQLSRNIAQQRVGLDTPTMRGVVSQGTLEGFSGFGLGTAVGGISAIPSRPAVEQEEGTQTSRFVVPESLELDAKITNDEEDVAIESLRRKNITPNEINIKEEVKRNRIAFKQLQDRGLDLADPETEREVRIEYENIRSLIDLAETEETVTGELFDRLGVKAKAVRDDFIGKPIRESIVELSQYANTLGKATTTRKRIKDFTSSYDTLFPVEEAAEETSAEVGEPSIVDVKKPGTEEVDAGQTDAGKTEEVDAGKTGTEEVDAGQTNAGQTNAGQAGADTTDAKVDDAEQLSFDLGAGQTDAGKTEEVVTDAKVNDAGKAEREANIKKINAAEKAEREANIEKAAREQDSIGLSKEANDELNEFLLPLTKYKKKDKTKSDKIVANYIKRFGNNYDLAFRNVAYNIGFDTKRLRQGDENLIARNQLIKEYKNEEKNFNNLPEDIQQKEVKELVIQNREEAYIARDELREEYEKKGKKKFEDLAKDSKRKLISDRISKNREKVAKGTGKLGSKVNAKKVLDWAKNNLPAEDVQKIEALIETEKTELGKQKEYKTTVVDPGKTEAQKDKDRQDRADKKADAEKATTEEVAKKAEQELKSMGITLITETQSGETNFKPRRIDPLVKKYFERAEETSGIELPSDVEGKIVETLLEDKSEAKETLKDEATKVLKNRGIKKPTEEQVNKQIEEQLKDKIVKEVKARKLLESINKQKKIQDKIGKAKKQLIAMNVRPTGETLEELQKQIDQAAVDKAAADKAADKKAAADKADQDAELREKRKDKQRSDAVEVLKKRGIKKPTEKQINEQIRKTNQEKETARTEEIKKLVQKYLEEAEKVSKNISTKDIKESTVKKLTKDTRISQAELENAIVDQINTNNIIETVFGSKPLPFDAKVDYQKNLSDIVKEELSAGNLSGALQALSKTLINRDLARFARRFSEVITTTKVKIVDNLTDENGTKLRGRFVPKTNTVEIDSDGGMNSHTILHEVGHALTSEEVAKGDKSPSVKRLRELYNIAKETINDVYGATNLDEFISESQSNTQFRKTLNRIKKDGSKFTVLQRVLHELGNILRRIIGIKSKPAPTTILSEIDVLVDSILSPSPEYRDATPLNAEKFADDASNAIKGNLSQDKIVKGIKDFLKGSKVKTLNKFVPSILNGTTFAKLARSVGFGNLGFSQLELIQSMIGEVQKVFENAEKKTIELAEIYKKFPEVEKVLNDIVYDMDYGATIYDVNPFAKISKYEGKTDESGNDLAKVWDEQQKKLNTLSAVEKSKAKEAYNLQKKEYREQFEALIRQILNLIDGQDLDAKSKESVKRTIVGKILSIKIEEEVEKQRSEATKVLKKKGIEKPTKEQIEEQVNKNNSVESMLKKLDDIEYFPLRRTGEYSLSYKITKKEKGKTMGENFDMFSSISDRDAAYEALKKADFAEDVKRYNGPKETQEGYANIKDVEPIIKIIEENVKDADTKKNIVEQIVNALASASPEKSLAQAFLNRKNIPGFEPNTLEAFKYKPYEIAYNRVKLKYSRDILALDKIIKKRYQEIREAKVPRLGVSKDLSVAITSVDAVYESLMDRSNYARQGADNKKLESYIRNINQGAFLYTIGFNPSSALVQLGQIPVFALSWFGGKYGMGKSVKAFSKAARIVISSSMNMASFYDIDETGKFSVKEDLDISAEKRKELEEVLPAVQNLYRRGGLQIDFDKEQKSTEELSPSKDKNPLDRATAASAIMFNWSERFNRQTMTIAAYLMSLDAGTKNNQGKKATKTQVEEALEESFLESSLANTGGQLEVAAPALKQGWKRIAGMYKGYGLSMYTLMFIDAYKGMTNAYPKTAQGRKERDIAFKRFVGVNLSSLLLLGVMGTPIYGLLEMILDSLFFWDDDDETKDIVRKSLPDVLSRGLIEGVTDMSVTDRLRLNNLVLQENRFAKTDESLEEIIGRYAGGPALSTFGRMLRAIPFFQEGEVRRGLENFVPAGIANLSKAERDFSEGAVKTKKGAIIQEDYGLLDTAYKVIGFQSAQLAKIQNVNRYKKRIDTEINSQRSRLMSKFNDAIFSGEGDLGKVLADIIEFNNEHPFDPITVDSMQKSNKSYTKRILQQRQGLTVGTDEAGMRARDFK